MKDDNKNHDNKKKDSDPINIKIPAPVEENE